MARPISQAINLLEKHLKVRKKDTFFNTVYSNLLNLMDIIKKFDDVKYNPATAEERKNREHFINLLNSFLENNLNCFIEPFKTIREIIDENLSYYSKEPIYCYWNGPGNISNTPPGIAILSNDSRDRMKQEAEPFLLDFKEQTIKNLDYLYLTPTGKILLDELLSFSRGNTSNENIHILPLTHNRGNNIISQNSKHALHLVADELLYEHKPLRHTAATLKKVAKHLHLQDPYQWLADQINQMPQLNYLGLPGNKPFLPELGIKLSKEDIENWLDGKLELNKQVKFHFLHAVIVALHSYSTPNVGTGSIIRWNPSPEYKSNRKRPIAIGLAHELCHAYYNATGMQPGFQEQDESTVLYEYLTTGLGPWKTAVVCENALRREWNELLPQIPKTELLNHKPVEERLYYALEEKPSSQDINRCIIN